MHRPGFHTSQIDYGEDELYFSYSSGFSYEVKNNSKLSDNILNVRYTPTDIYFEDASIKKDIDVSYLVRKGVGKNLVHPENSICVDGLNHSETAAIFKRSKRFISYDLYTAYSHFAVLCGCESVVVPDERVSLSEWYPKMTDRLGVAYGFDADQIKFSLDTKKDLIDKLLNENLLSIQSVRTALEEILNFFE
ncbi:hypothetical protein [Acinetobacter wanghuae]|uniref:hypothetical protein n=1 Tax=Acinetobacter wanghuae TaxID=2662362 RepID=UPI003AF97C97